LRKRQHPNDERLLQLIDPALGEDDHERTKTQMHVRLLHGEATGGRRHSNARGSPPALSSPNALTVTG